MAAVQLPTGSPFEASQLSTRHSTPLELTQSFHNLSCRMSSRIFTSLSHVDW